MNGSSAQMRLAALVATLAMISLTAGAGAQNASTGAQVRVGASASLEPLALAASKKYGLQATGIAVSVTPDPPGGAISALSAGTIDVAFTGAAPADKAMLDHRVAVLPFAFVTNHKAGVSSLTAPQIRDLLSGKIANWNEIGGGDVPVRVIGRGAGSEITQLLQRRYLAGKPLVAGASVADVTATVIGAVEKTTGAVAVVPFASARATNGAVDTLALDGNAPDEAHVGDGSYPLWTYEHAVTLHAPSADVERFLSDVQSDRTLLRSLGFISVSDLGPGALKP